MKCFLIHRATDVNIILRMGSLSSAQYSTFHDISRNSSSWVYLRGDTAFWALDHTEVLVYGSYRGACHSFHLFSHGNCNSVHLSGISLTHYRTMLVVIPFFPFCNLKKKRLPLDQNWFWPHLGHAMMKQEEISGSWLYLWGHGYLLTCCLPRV